MLQREFLTYAESANLVGDAESLRQVVLLGDVRVYIELSDCTGSVAYPKEKLRGQRMRFASWTRPNFYYEDDGDHDFKLSGWFILDSFHAQSLSRSKPWIPTIEMVSPPKNFYWSAEVAPALDDASECPPEPGDPLLFHARLDPLPKLSELWFRRGDIERLAASLMQGAAASLEVQGPTKQPKLRSDREQNLLRVIAALWAMSELPKEHNVAADKLSALMEGWSWDKPVAGTIADKILKEAANLPGAKVRS